MKVVNIKKVTLPDWLDYELWQDFIQFRIEMKSPLTATGEKRALLRLGRLIEAGGDQTCIVERSITNGWKGLFMATDDDDKVLRGNGKHNVPDYRDETALNAYGQSIGIQARPGESSFQYRERLIRSVEK